MNELDKYLKKIGINYEDLTGEEKETYKTWDVVFQKGINTDNIIAFVSYQVHRLNGELLDAIEKDDSGLVKFLGGRLKNYNELKAFLTEPQNTRENLKKQLKNLSESKKL